jgi:hypothetical protein
MAEPKRPPGGSGSYRGANSSITRGDSARPNPPLPKGMGKANQPVGIEKNRGKAKATGRASTGGGGGGASRRS